MKKFKRLLKKYAQLLSEFGVRLSLIEFSLQVIGFISKKSDIWKKISAIKYREIQSKIEKECATVLLKYKDIDSMNNKITDDCPIWIYWAQGYSDAPDLVKECIANVKRNSEGHNVILLSLDNLKNYVRIPYYIWEKYNMGIISQAHFSDILRFDLLARYGGIWMDATLLQINSNTISRLNNYTFYSIKHGIGKGYLPCQGNWSTFFIASSKDNLLALFVYECLLIYWKKHNSAIDYLFLDSIINMGYERIDIIRHMIDQIPLNNIQTFELMNAVINDDMVFNQEFLLTTDLFKLTYKYGNLNFEKIAELIR